MPKKPFTQEEITAQRQRIMDSASQVMATVGFHHLSMRKLASQLNMTASNIYNYFPNKELLFTNTRLRGFEMFLGENTQLMQNAESAQGALKDFAYLMINFAQSKPGYYQLMFQPPKLSLQDMQDVSMDQEVVMLLDRLAEEWQNHLLSLMIDAIPAMAAQNEQEQKQIALFFVSSLHGLIDSFRNTALTHLLSGVELIPEDVVKRHVSWLLKSLAQESERTLA